MKRAGMSASDYGAYKSFWMAWLAKYKALHCLWDVNSEDYNNREQRQNAYAELREMAKKLIPSADEVFVRNKINNFRTNYRKEVRKILAARNNGALVEPSFTYYGILNSILRLDPNHSSYNDFDHIEHFDDDLIYCDPLNCDNTFLTTSTPESKTIDNDSNSLQRSPSNSVYERNESINDFNGDSVSSSQQEAFSLPAGTRKASRKRCASKSESECFSKGHTNVRNNTSTVNPNETADNQEGPDPPRKNICLQNNDLSRPEITVQREEDEWDILGKRIASHFRNMQPIQRLLAERIICDVCIQGRVDQLDWETDYVVPRRTRPNKPTSAFGNDHLNVDDEM